MAFLKILLGMGQRIWRICLSESPNLTWKLLLEAPCEICRSPQSLGHVRNASALSVKRKGCRSGLWGPFLLITPPPDPSHWPRKETDGTPRIALNSRWLLAV